MAKKTKNGKKKKNEAKASPVVCFFFYGSIEDLGTQLAKFADESQLAAELAASLANFSTPKTT